MKILFGLVVGLLCGILIGWWLWHGGAVAAPAPQEATPHRTSTGAEEVSVNIGDFRLRVVRMNTHWVAGPNDQFTCQRSVDVVVENRQKPETPVDAVILNNAKVLRGDASLNSIVRIHVGGKAGFPPGIGDVVLDGMYLVTFYFTDEPLPTATAGAATRPDYTLQFTLGPAGTPVTLAPLVFPDR